MSAGITLVGAGALGQALAALLVRSGPTTLLARGRTLDELRAAGVLPVRGGTVAEPVRLGPETGDGTVRLVHDAAALDPAETVVFATKGPALATAAEAVAATWRPAGGCVAGLQNGVVKDRVLGGIFGPDAVVGAATVLGAKRVGAEVVITGLGLTYLGEFGGSASERLTRLAARLDLAGVPYLVTGEIDRLLWTKCANALAAFGTSALTRLPSTAMMRRESAVRAFLDLLGEAAAVAAAAGSPVGDFPELPIATYLAGSAADLLARVRATPEPAEPSYSSMAADVIAARPTEVEPVFGPVLDRAAELGVPVPRLELVRRLVTTLDEVSG